MFGRWILKITETQVKKQQLYKVLITKVKTIDKDANWDTLKEIKSPIFNAL